MQAATKVRLVRWVIAAYIVLSAAAVVKTRDDAAEERARLTQKLNSALDVAQALADRAREAEDLLSTIFGATYHPDRVAMEDVEATAYTAKENSHTTSLGKTLAPGGCAPSRDLAIPYGARVLIVDGETSATCIATANDRHPGSKAIDLYVEDQTVAKAYGRSTKTAIWLLP